MGDNPRMHEDLRAINESLKNIVKELKKMNNPILQINPDLTKEEEDAGRDDITKECP